MRDAMKDGSMKLASIQAAEKKLLLNTYQRTRCCLWAAVA